MSFIFTLPKYPLINFLSSWCDLKDVARLDSAFCNCSERKLFLDIQPLLPLVAFNHKSSFANLKWLWTKELKLSTLNITTCTIYTIYRLFETYQNVDSSCDILSNFEARTTLQLFNFKKALILSLNVRSLTVTDDVISDTSCIDYACAAASQLAEVYNLNILTATNSFSMASNLFRNLIYFKFIDLNSIKNSLTEDIILQFLHHNKQLETLILYNKKCDYSLFSFKFINSLIESNFVNLKMFEVQIFEEINFYSLSGILQFLPNYVNFEAPQSKYCIDSRDICNVMVVVYFDGNCRFFTIENKLIFFESLHNVHILKIFHPSNERRNYSTNYHK
jgi:hypothetical protein